MISVGGNDHPSVFFEHSSYHSRVIDAMAISLQHKHLPVVFKVDIHILGFRNIEMANLAIRILDVDGPAACPDTRFKRRTTFLQCDPDLHFLPVDTKDLDYIKHISHTLLGTSRQVHQTAKKKTQKLLSGHSLLLNVTSIYL